jgi:ketosteroid isomerase-like protein
MSEENIELVRRTMEAFNRGGPVAVISGGFLSAEIVFDASRAEIPGIGVARGTNEVRAFFEEDWFGAFPFEEWEIQVEEPIVDHGDQVIFKTRQQGRGVSSGAAAVLELGNILTIRDGEIVRIEIYRRPEDAFEAAGRAE